MTDQTSGNAPNQTAALLDEIMMSPSREVVSDRFNAARASEAPCGTACGAGCGGGCGGSA